MRCLAQEAKTNDWPKLVPFCTWLMNSQISGSTGYSPSELFLRRPSWKFDLIQEPGTNPSVESILMDQLKLQEIASQKLAKRRTTSFSQRNKGRTSSAYNVGGFVLVHKSRWPQRKIPKLESPWFGPFKIVEVHFNRLKVMSSPHLGGLIDVTFHHCKRWSDLVEINFEEPDDQIVAQEDQESGPKVPEPDSQIFTREEGEEMGFYNVEDILRHTYQQGWRFLVRWENFSFSSATWEPWQAFLLPHGDVNQVFQKYCERHGLVDILKKAFAA